MSTSKAEMKVGAYRVEFISSLCQIFMFTLPFNGTTLFLIFEILEEIISLRLGQFLLRIHDLFRISIE
jgi:hypothetical protein